MSIWGLVVKEPYCTSAGFSLAPCALPFRRLMMCTSWGRLVVPRLAQPDRAVKLFNMAWTGWPTPTGKSSQGLRDNGPANNRKHGVNPHSKYTFCLIILKTWCFTYDTLFDCLNFITRTGFYIELCKVTLNPCHKYAEDQSIPYGYVQASYNKNP